MPRIEDIQKDLLQMSPDELRAFIRQVRSDRRISKEPKKVRKTRVRKEDTARSNVSKLVGQLSPSELESLLEGLSDDETGTPED